MWALEDDVSGPLNVASPDPRLQREFAGAIAAVLGRPRRLSVPAPLIRLALGGQATLVLDSRRVLPAKALGGGYVFRRPRLEDALRHALVRA